MRFLLVSTALAGFALPALANDGFGGFSATGLTFTQTDAVAMEQEDLFISMDKISVDYVFRNTSGADVTGEVIFPLPPVMLGTMLESSYNLPEDISRENLMDFKAVVDGVEVPVQIDRIAVIEPPWDENAPAAQQYDAPGRDVTAELAKFGLPLSIDAEAVAAQMREMPRDQQDAMKAAGLADFYEYDDGGVTKQDAYPAWSVVLRYHWTQTFPAGAVVKVSHSYENHPPGGLFGWEDPVTSDYLMDEQARYCIDAGTSKAIAKALTYNNDGDSYIMGIAHNLQYVLRTANSWAGPIGKFKLTVDKGKPENVISLCADGVKKTGPTTFVVEKTNYAPDRDLEILIAAPMEPVE